jgi:hypothetical protein
LKEWIRHMHCIPSYLGFESSYMKQQPINRKGRGKKIYNYVSASKIEGTIYNAMKI